MVPIGNKKWYDILAGIQMEAISYKILKKRMGYMHPYALSDYDPTIVTTLGWSN